MEKRTWQTSRRCLDLSRTLVMAILNVTPDSFSDGGKFIATDDALRQAEKLIADGADIIDVGGESTRPGGVRVSAEDETRRVAPVIAAIVKRFDIPVSIDTTKSLVAERSLLEGAEIINDVSGLRFDEKLAELAANSGCGLILMHLKGEFETMHQKTIGADLIAEVTGDMSASIAKARNFGVRDDQICLDVGIGFSKTLEQNLELVAKLDKICEEFPHFPMLVGLSRKSFIGNILGGVPPDERLFGTIAANSVAVLKCAKVIRVHDVSPAVEAAKVCDAIKKHL